MSWTLEDILVAWDTIISNYSEKSAELKEESVPASQAVHAEMLGFHRATDLLIKELKGRDDA